ncbi:hypothetical protein AWZ03_000704 [Drosophila navojoa]|uniref:Uncharacterized protein n=1 Tax=Drosophila navojoa TaxID=7232 RepID=A0A484C188_DRONA|nr:hypothetical protein AWZ03_000704 [Drosophila navojoa]
MTDFRPKFGSIRKDRIEDPEDRRYFVYQVVFPLYPPTNDYNCSNLYSVNRHLNDEVILSNESAMIVLFFMGLLFFLVFAVSPQLRHRVFANWLVTFVIVEAQVLAVSLLAVRSEYLLMLIGFVVVLVVMAVVFIVVIFLPIIAYHEQAILGKGEVRSSLHDDKFCALLLFHDFLALFLPTFYWYYW